MAELIERLQTALAGTYEIERELGGGGMSRVFLAHELGLGRQVVVKVLPPDTAAEVNKERFQREIQVAASLQHPHVVPLLTAGSHEDILYYVMPYIEGESLRERLAREGELPVGEAARLLREVCDALSYAHSRGIVHRDIKPDNVMLSNRHALVADFGVAKAVTASSGGKSSLTSLGVALGTPAYMAPEQAAADPHVDHRADLYAVGCLAYEMICGRTVFDATSPQGMLAAHVTREPTSIAEHRPSVPPVLADVVMRCLAKKAADRVQSADELLSVLEGVITPSAGMTPTHTKPVDAYTISSADRATRHARPGRVAMIFGLVAAGVLALVYGVMLVLGLPDWVFLLAVVLLAVGLPIMIVTSLQERQRAMADLTGIRHTTPVGLKKLFTWRKAIAGGVLAFAALSLGAAGYMGARSLGIGPAATLMTAGAFGENDRLLISDFSNRTTDSTLGPTVSELFRVGMSQSPVLKLVSETQKSDILRRMELPGDVEVGQVRALEMAEREGLKAVVVGEVAPLGEGYALSVRVLSATGEELLAERAQARNEADLISAVDNLSAAVRERVGESLRTIRSNRPLGQVTTGSLEALRLYTQAERADDMGEFTRAVGLLEQAIELDTSFAMAYRKLGAILGNSFEQRARAIEMLTKAYEYRDRLTEQERAYAEGLYFNRVDYQPQRVINAYTNILQRYPDDQTALNNLGVIHFIRGDFETAADYYRRAVAADPTQGLLLDNLVGINIGLGRLEVADSLLTEFERIVPGSPRITRHRSNIAWVSKDYAQSEEWARQELEESRGDLAATGNAVERLGQLALMQGRLSEAEQHYGQLLQTLEQRNAGPVFVDKTLDLGYGYLLFTGDLREATSRVETALDRYPMEEMPAPERSHGFVAAFYALAGDTARARNELAKEAELVMPGPPEHFLDLTRGDVLLAEGKYREAIAAYRRFGTNFFCEVCMYDRLGEAFMRAGNQDSAIANYDRYLLSTMRFDWWDKFSYPVALRNAGELHESAGNSDMAVRYYSEFADLWDRADDQLQPVVQDVRARIARLSQTDR